MTISSETRKAGPFVGNDATTAFPFAFKVFSTSDVYVVRADAAGAETTLTLTTDYTVSLNADQNANPGGTVTLLAPLATGYTLALTSSLQYLQQTDLTSMGGFYPPVVTNALDRLTIFCQQLSERIGRAALVPLSSTAATRANKVIGFDALGNAVLYVAQAGSSLIDLGASTGASLIGWIQSGAGAISRTVQDKLCERVSVKDFGAVGDGTANDSAAILAANATGKQVFFPDGTYLLQSNISFTKPPIFQPGAVLKVRGAVATFSAGIEAGWHTIFDTTDDFVADLTANSSVIIRGGPVKADWFAARVASADSITTVPDQTNNLTKAFRAAAGNYIARGSNFANAYPEGVLELGIGHYRVDGTFALGKQVGGTYYKLNGFRITGQGPGQSYLVRTNMASTAYVMFAAFYTGELTLLEKFKVVAYNPDGATSADKFDSAARAMMYCQGDSLQLNNIWVAGAKVTTTDTNGIKRNGIGVQFSSCVDTYFHDLFVEFCATGVAFGSSIVSGTNLELYHTLNQAIGLGVFVADWPDTQTTSSRVHIDNIQGSAIYNYGITVLEKGDTGVFVAANSGMDGYDSENAVQAGTIFCHMVPNTRLSGGVPYMDVRNFVTRTFSINDGCYLGAWDRAFNADGLSVQNITADTGGGIFYTAGTGCFGNVMCRGLSATDINGVILQSPQSGSVVINGASLSRYVGKVDGSANRQLFIALGCDIVLRDFKRNTSDTTALNQFGFATSGKIHVDINDLYNATRVISGAGTFTMPSKVVFA